ncbi:class I SAM-dependent methyltransferase [Nannocystaceae bacterium ST9]
MDDDDDALGALLLAHWRGADETGVLERDDGHVDVGSVRTFFTGPDEWQPHVHEALAHAKGRVLDVGCGVGRHAIHLQSLGLAVTGIDISPGAIEVARARGLIDARVLSIDALGELEPGAFSTVLMLWNNFGLFGTPERAKPLLEVLDRITTADARILAASRDPSSLPGEANERARRANLARGRSAGQLRLRFRYGARIGAWYDYLLVGVDEMQTILSGTAWTTKQVHSSGADHVAVFAKRSACADV